jgi:hypothetical protein
MKPLMLFLGYADKRYFDDTEFSQEHRIISTNFHITKSTLDIIILYYLYISI